MIASQHLHLLLDGAAVATIPLPYLFLVPCNYKIFPHIYTHVVVIISDKGEQILGEREREEERR